MEELKTIAQIAFFTTGILGVIVAAITYIVGLGASVKSLEKRFDSLEKSIQEWRQELRAEIKSVDKKVDALMMHLIKINSDDNPN